jgi:hypothetical protein
MSFSIANNIRADISSVQFDVGMNLLDAALDPDGASNGPNTMSLGLGVIGGAGFKVARMLSKQAKKFAQKYKGKLCNCCFVEGTLISTKDGLKPIENLQVGELVSSKNLETGELNWQPIVETFVFDDDRKTYELFVESSEGDVNRFEVTDNHPFWVVGKGWVDSGDLVPGMQLSSSKQVGLNVKELIKLDRSPVTYNIEVAGYHNYFVGKQKALVHNCSCDKILSQALMVRYAKVEPSMLKGALPAKAGGSPGHAYSSHLVPNEVVADIINMAQRKFVGTNRNGRDVNIFWKDGSVVITQGNDITRIITAHGLVDRRKKVPTAVDPKKWIDPKDGGVFHEITD